MSEPTRPCARCDGVRHWTGSRWRCARCNWEYQQKRRASLTPQQRETERARGNELRGIVRAARTPQKRSRDIAAVQAWRDADPERHRAGSRDWYRRNAESARAAKLAEYYADPESFYARNLVRKARINDAVCEHGPKCVSARFLRSMYHAECLYCGDPAEAADHFVPLARGGLHCVENIVPACQPCNSSKSARDPVEWLASLAS